MKVKAIVNVSGIKFSLSKGEVKELDKGIAADLLISGLAESGETDKKITAEVKKIMDEIRARRTAVSLPADKADQSEDKSDCSEKGGEK